MGTTAVNIHKLRELLKEFHLLTQVRISFWDTMGKRCVISGMVADSPFCSRLRSCPELNEACAHCDREGLRVAQETGRLHVFTCHAGLHEYVYPVVESGRMIGFFMIGQVYMPELYGDLVGDHAAQWAEHGIDADEMRDLLNCLPVMTHEKMLAAAHMLEVLAGYVYIKGLVRSLEPTLCEKLEAYVAQNLDRQISLDEIASALYVSRSTLCHKVRKERNMSVVELIQDMRVKKVIELMRGGMSPNAAAAEAGFSSFGYCVRVFKRTLGVAPSAFIEEGGNIK